MLVFTAAAAAKSLLEASSRAIAYTRGTAFLVEGQGIGKETI